MWNSILETTIKGIANDDPKLVEQILESNTDFRKWVKYFNPNDIQSMKENEKIVVKILAEDLQDLMMRGRYFRFQIKKTDDLKYSEVWKSLADICNIYFWLAVRTKYKLWNPIDIGMRDGFQVVEIPCNHDMPDVIKKMLGLE